jgi:hypothetical protein
VLSCAAALIISQAFEVAPGTDLNCLVGALFILSILALFGGLIVILIMGREPQFRRVRQAVKIKSYERGWRKKGGITVAFANDQFADLFRQMNAGAVLGSSAR